MEQSKQAYWIPLADLMTGLMMIFMLITAVYIQYVERTTTLVLDEFKDVKSNMQLAAQKTQQQEVFLAAAQDEERMRSQKGRRAQ